MKTFASVLGHDLEQQPLTWPTAFSQPKLQDIAAGHAVFHVVQLFIPLVRCVEIVTNMAATVDRESVPEMSEFFRNIWYERRDILRKRRWP